MRLRAAGLTDEAARRVHRVTRGHPLALRVAAAGAAAMPGAELEEVAAQQVVEELAGPHISPEAIVAAAVHVPEQVQVEVPA